VGEISELRGNGEVLRADQTDKLLARTSLDILSYDDVRTGNGRLGITFLDSSVIRLTEHSKIIIDEYIFDPNPSKSKMALKMASGTARFITGALGKIDKENISIETPSASIFIRGTDFTTTVDELGRSLIILLPNPDGTTSGSISVETIAGTEVLNQPFQATMVSVAERPPTQPVVLANLSLNFIDNLLIVSPPQEVERAVEDQSTSSSNVLDADFLEENDLDDDSGLSEDELQDEITRLDIDLLAVDFLQDLLEIIEDLGKKEETASEIDGVRIEGIVAGFDQDAQVYTFVEGEILTLVRQVENTIDLELDKSGGYNIQILSAGKQINITTNGGGENEIIINQSD
jgi:hypothetical protein|tara:strand:+ start:255 stop:1292 length:1038 start_codon:yes stop_codon:yes gene_type:complete